MELERWEESWRAGRTPWDAGGPAAQLEALLEAGALPRGRALVPGCGSGYDVLALAGAGCQVQGLEVAPTAIERFRNLRRAAGLDASAATVIRADYFGYAPEAPFDLIWDYTFLCAIAPEAREAWARQAHALLKPGAELATLIFPVLAPPGELGPGPHEGPPYPLDPHQVRALLLPHFEEIHLAPATHSHSKRAGREWLGRWRRR